MKWSSGEYVHNMHNIAPHRPTSKWSEVEQIEANYIIIS